MNADQQAKLRENLNTIFDSANIQTNLLYFFLDIPSSYHNYCYKYISESMLKNCEQSVSLKDIETDIIFYNKLNHVMDQAVYIGDVKKNILSLLRKYDTKYHKYIYDYYHKNYSNNNNYETLYLDDIFSVFKTLNDVE
jgi:hypothetical protein